MKSPGLGVRWTSLSRSLHSSALGQWPGHGTSVSLSLKWSPWVLLLHTVVQLGCSTQIILFVENECYKNILYCYQLFSSRENKSSPGLAGFGDGFWVQAHVLCPCLYLCAVLPETPVPPPAPPLRPSRTVNKYQQNEGRKAQVPFFT